MPLEKVAKLYCDEKLKKRYKYANRQDLMRWMNAEIQLIPLNDRHRIYFQVPSSLVVRFNAIIGRDSKGKRTRYEDIGQASKATGIPKTTIYCHVADETIKPESGITWRWDRQ